MDFRDRTTDATLAEIARLLSTAYVRYRRARRIESAKDASESVNGELDNPRPENQHAREVDRRARCDGRAGVARRASAA
jgi:hypothetical protein